MIPHLVLFFTRGVSLRTWSMVGMLEREIALYRRLIENGLQVSFVTYGDASDQAFEDRLGGIRILCNRSGLDFREYEQGLFSLHEDTLKNCTVIKTNQTYGADIALNASRMFGKPLVARCGYMWSANAGREHGEESAQAIEARRVEELVFEAADKVVVTTYAMKSDVERRIPSAAQRVKVIPNYVDTELFSPAGTQRDAGTVLFIGRIAPEKNLESLIEAVEPLDLRLTLIGEGKLRPVLQRRFNDLDGRITWEGNVPNSQLPNYLNRSGCFVLPSLYEGHPKSLLEAMSCGVPVIGANSPGIRELIRHRETGLLCGTDAAAIRAALEEVMSQPALGAELGRNARDFVIENYSLGRIVQMELDLLNEIVHP